MVGVDRDGKLMSAISGVHYLKKKEKYKLVETSGKKTHERSKIQE